MSYEEKHATTEENEDAGRQEPQPEESKEPQIEESVEDDGASDDNMPEQSEAEDREDYEAVEPTLESVIEAVLFASDEPLTEARLVKIAEAGSVKQIRQAVESLNEHYRTTNRSFRIEKIAGGYQMMTIPPYNHWLGKLFTAKKEEKLSQPALETLAIIAYKQPIIRADIEAIRGVAAGEMIRSLMYKGLVKIVGRAEVLGRPMLYGTTKKFLDLFGLATLKDLPKIEELKKPKE